MTDEYIANIEIRKVIRPLGIKLYGQRVISIKAIPIDADVIATFRELAKHLMKSTGAKQ